MSRSVAGTKALVTLCGANKTRSVKPQVFLLYRSSAPVQLRLNADNAAVQTAAEASAVVGPLGEEPLPEEHLRPVEVVRRGRSTSRTRTYTSTC